MSSKKLQTERREQRKSLLLSATALAAAAVAMGGAPAYAQESDEGEAIVVTGTRIQRQDFVSTSPITTVQQEQIVGNADITIETFLNTLPSVNPAGTSTSNNPGNGGQSNVDLRGLGANRNLVLIDGRRAMVSASSQTVDLNTIPQAMIESVEVITGGAGAVYGADAIAGAVNFRLRDDFEGLDFRATYSDSTEYSDSEEYNLSGVVGGNFADGRGNFTIGLERSVRELLIKSQRDFSSQATATTSFLPEGNLFFSSTNAPTEAAFDSIFAGYGSGAANQTIGSGRIGFNLDGSLFYTGVFNNPLDAVNFDYPIDTSVNTSLYPDVYSYNFDAVNILVLPFERTSFLSRFDYEFDNDISVYGRVGWSEYTSATALAPTPIPTVSGRAPGFTSTNNQWTSSLITAGNAVLGCGPGGAPGTCQISNLMLIPTTNPFIPTDLATLLNSRSGDNPAIVGSGASEPFTLRQRTLALGLRESTYENTVVQFLFGFNGPVGDSGWDFDVSFFHGITEIDQTQFGNVDTQRLQTLLEAPDGGASICAGGFNPFGRQPISDECATYLEVSGSLTNEFILDVLSGYVTGPLFDLPAGPVQAVLGAEWRGFQYSLDPGSSGGPISGFNAQNPAGGDNSFTDLFTELLFPIADGLEATIGARWSRSQFNDTVNAVEGDTRTDPTYKAELTWRIVDPLLLRASFQHAVRAPNFGELFDGGGSAPQYFEPCSVGTAARSGANGAQVAALCTAQGVGGIGTYVQSPGTQLSLTTAGNTDLSPEEADTYTIGAVFSSPWPNVDLRASIDYYHISISDVILAPSPNVVIADCFNYYGNNPTYSAANPNCAAIVRAGGDALFLSGPNADGTYPGINGGGVEVTGIDVQIDYGLELGNAGALRFNALFSHVMEWTQQDSPDLPEIDYAGTVTFFGEGLGLGGSIPEWRVTLNSSWEVGALTFFLRNRYISEMENRASVIFPGETFTGADAIWYHDATVQWNMTENATVRVGVNNLLDEEPPQFRPNVQSGTDPSLYDVVGRRGFVQLNLRY